MDQSNLHSAAADNIHTQVPDSRAFPEAPSTPCGQVPGCGAVSWPCESLPRGAGLRRCCCDIPPASCSVVCQAVVLVNRLHRAAGQAGAAADKLGAAVAGSPPGTGAQAAITAGTAGAAAATSGAAAAVAAGPAAAAAETAVANERQAGASACKGWVSVCGLQSGCWCSKRVGCKCVLMRNALNRSD